MPEAKTHFLLPRRISWRCRRVSPGSTVEDIHHILASYSWSNYVVVSISIPRDPLKMSIASHGEPLNHNSLIKLNSFS